MPDLAVFIPNRVADKLAERGVKPKPGVIEHLSEQALLKLESCGHRIGRVDAGTAAYCVDEAISEFIRRKPKLLTFGGVNVTEFRPAVRDYIEQIVGRHDFYMRHIQRRGWSQTEAELIFAEVAEDLWRTAQKPETTEIEPACVYKAISGAHSKRWNRKGRSRARFTTLDTLDYMDANDVTRYWRPSVPLPPSELYGGLWDSFTESEKRDLAPYYDSGNWDRDEIARDRGVSTRTIDRQFERLRNQMEADARIILHDGWFAKPR